MVQLIHGSIFDSKCDLLIIPCNEFGGVSLGVSHSLTAHSLPKISSRIMAGSVKFVDNTGAFANATVLGYAASVSVGDQSTADNVRSIVSDILWACERLYLRRVNIPLLGTGAGGLNPRTSYQIICDAFANNPKIDVSIYVIDELIYRNLAKQNDRDMGTQARKMETVVNPRVFISYTGTDPQNAKWVKELTIKLRNSGVDARLDYFHLKPGFDLPQWMADEVIKAQKVLLICDKYYAEKADMRKGGVGWETMIIQGDMLANQDQNKYIAIIRDSNIDESLPVYVKSKYALNWAEDSKADSEFDELLLQLFDCNTEPPIGDIPDFVLKSLKS